MKKKILIWIIAAIVLVALAIIFLPKLKTAKTEKPKSAEVALLEKKISSLEAQTNEVNAENLSLSDSLQAVAAKAKVADSLQRALNQCQGIPAPMTDAQKLAAYEKRYGKLDAPKSNKKPVVKKAPVKRSAPKADVAEVDFGSSFSVKTTSIAAPVSYAAASTQFFGQMKGSYFTTIDAEGYLMYGISKSLSTQAPRLNGINGQLFVSNGSYWTCTDKTRLISVAEINSADATVVWTVYIGQKNYGTGSYPMFLPHESLKPLIVEARGYDYGAITSTDIQRMAQTNPLVGKSLIPNSAEGHSSTDQNFWNGWSFRSKIVAVKKTTTTSKDLSLLVPIYKTEQIRC